MKHFRNQLTSEVFAFEEDGSQDDLVTGDMVPMTAAEVAAHENPPLTKQELLASLTGAVQAHLDVGAKDRGYDGILSACSYASSGIAKFRTEGQAFVGWRDAVWMKCHALETEVDAGKRAAPEPQELLGLLPKLEMSA